MEVGPNSRLVWSNPSPSLYKLKQKEARKGRQARDDANSCHNAIHVKSPDFRCLCDWYNAGVNAMLWLVFKMFETCISKEFNWLTCNSIYRDRSQMPPGMHFVSSSLLSLPSLLPPLPSSLLYFSSLPPFTPFFLYFPSLLPQLSFFALLPFSPYPFFFIFLWRIFKQAIL